VGADVRLCVLIVMMMTMGAMGSSAIAEPTKQAPPAAGAASDPTVSSDPQATSATYGDWVLVCQRAVDGSAARVCEVSQSIQVQGQTGPIAQLAISRAKEAPSASLTAVVPPNVLLTADPRAAVDEKDNQGIALGWVRCLPGGCFAVAALKEETLSKWRAQTDRGRLEFKDAGGRTLVIPFSFKGLGAAYAALEKE